MEENKRHFQHVMFYCFKQGKDATEIQVKICAVYEEGAMTDLNMLKVVCEVLCWSFLVERCSVVG